MKISPAITAKVSRAILHLRKYSPQIMTATGVVGVTTAAVLAARATLRFEETVDTSQKELNWARQSVEEGQESKIVVTRAYVTGVMRITKLYAPAVFLGVASIGCIVGGQVVVTRRNVALAAAYKGLESAFSNYRDRVRDEYGDEVADDFRYGTKTETKTNAKGKITQTKTLVDGEHSGSEYRFVYDMENENWSGFHDQNLFRLTAVQNMFNDRLRAYGHVFLHEVLDTLGYKRTPASAVVGWVYDPKNPAHPGDNYIDFNIQDYQESEECIILDFNVDGVIYDKI